MLIAIMGQSHHRVSQQSELVALSGRAKLILEYEADELRDSRRRASRRRGRRLGQRAVPGVDDAEELRMERVCPRWLHVLMPAEHQRGDDGVGAEELRELKLLRKQMTTMGDALAEKQRKVLDAIEKRDVQEERQRMVQAMRVELDKVRGEINDDFKKAVGR